MKFTTVIIFIAVYLIQVVSVAQTFCIHDVIVSDSSTSLSDAEFDWYGNHIVWSGPEGIWLAHVDSLTGDIYPCNGKGILLDSTPSFSGMRICKNGPEWNMSQQGSEIIYPDSTTSSSGFFIGRIKYDNGQWIQSPPPGSLDLIPYISSYDTDYPNGAISCAELDSISMTYTKVVIRYVNYSASKIPIGSDIGDSRWIKGAEGVSFCKKINGIRQGCYYLYSQGQTVQVTNNNYQKEFPWMLRAPEYNNELVFACVEHKPGFDEFAIYRSIDSVWTKVDSMPSPSDRKMISSPEPFWWNNQTFLFFTANRYPFDPWDLYDQIWIMRLAPNDHFERMVSKATDANRKDPEVYYTTTGPLIYYTEIREGIRIFHKCATGLDDILTSILSVNNEAGTINPYPNPVSNVINIYSKLGYRIYNSTGQLIKQSDQPTNSIDISDLLSGFYFLKRGQTISRFIKAE
jgi:hypothetical protein